MILAAFFVTYPNDLRAERRIDEAFDVQIITMVTAVNLGTKINYNLTYTMYHKNWSSVNF